MALSGMREFDKMHDPVKLALWIGGIALFCTLASGVYLVWANAGSRNLALGLGALAGACVVFFLQVIFELKGSTSATDFPVEFTIDYGSKAVRSPRAFRPAAFGGYRNLLVEQSASDVISAASPPFTANDAPKIVRDLAVVSIASYLFDEQFDWQLDPIVYRTTIGTAAISSPLSKPVECTSFDIADITAKLKRAGNMFAEISPLSISRKLCLPPHSTIEITSNSILLRTLVCEIEITLREPFVSMHTMDPHAVAAAVAAGSYIEAQMPTLPDGSPKYNTIVMGGRAKVTFSALRAQSSDLPKYQAWSTRVVAGISPRLALAQQQ